MGLPSNTLVENREWMDIEKLFVILSLQIVRQRCNECLLQSDLLLLSPNFKISNACHGKSLDISLQVLLFAVVGCENKTFYLNLSNFKLMR